MMIIWWLKHVGVILSVLMCDIWINVLLQTSALVGPLYIGRHVLSPGKEKEFAFCIYAAMCVLKVTEVGKLLASVPWSIQIKKIDEVWNGNKCADLHCFVGTSAFQSGRLKLPAWR
jgi:hypothetical protein